MDRRLSAGRQLDPRSGQCEWPEPAADLHAEPFAHTMANTPFKTNAHIRANSHTRPHPHTYGDAHAYGDTASNSYSYANSHAHTNAYSHTHTSARPSPLRIQGLHA